jgi:RecG-like helicase
VSKNCHCCHASEPGFPTWLISTDVKSSQALTDDGTHAKVMNGKANVSFIQDTIYCKDIGMVLVDEAHMYRNPNKAAESLKALLDRADFKVLMTATPIITRPLVRIFYITFCSSTN